MKKLDYFLWKYLGAKTIVWGSHGYIRFGDSWNHLEINWHLSSWYLPFSFSVHDGIGFWSVGFFCFDIFFKRLSWMPKNEKKTTVKSLADLEGLEDSDYDFVFVEETGKEYIFINKWEEL